MLRNIQRMPRGQRLVVFILIFGGGLALILGLTALLYFNSIRGVPRSMGTALVEGVNVREYVQLPDNDSYPAAVTTAPDGTAYTGSYVSGAIWRIDPTGTLQEVPGSRDGIGAVAGLTLDAGGSLLIVDIADADPQTNGGSLKRLASDGTLSIVLAQPDAEGFISPDDVTVDSAGLIYVSDRGRDTVWRVNPDGSAVTAWWQPPALDGVEFYDPTGLTYDAATDTILISDGTADSLYRVPVGDPTQATLLYWHEGRPNPPGFDGLTIASDGRIYIAALAQRGIVRLEGEALVYLAGLFRAPSDVDMLGADRLIVTNWDSFSLAVPAVPPNLPFALDITTLPTG
jgi:sugar lactone lactonase YvrE